MENTSISTCFQVALPFYQKVTRMTFPVIGLSSNSLLLVGLMMDPLKCFKNSSSHLVVNLCVADILTCLGVVLILSLGNPCIDGGRWYLFLRLPMYISFSSVLTMAFDRYMSCCHPLKYKVVITRKLTKRLILIQWLFYIVKVILELFYDKFLFYPRYIMGIFTVFASVTLYIKAAYELNKKSRYLRNIMDIPASVGQQQEVRLLKEKRFLTTIFMVSCISLLTFLPLVIYDTISGTPYYMNNVEASSLTGIVQFCLLTLFVVNFWINPLVYSWRLTRYRKTLSIVLKRLVSIH